MNFLDVEEISTPSRSLWQKWAAYFFITYTSKNKMINTNVLSLIILCSFPRKSEQPPQSLPTLQEAKYNI